MMKLSNNIKKCLSEDHVEAFYLLRIRQYNSNLRDVVYSSSAAARPTSSLDLTTATNTICFFKNILGLSLTEVADFQQYRSVKILAYITNLNQSVVKTEIQELTVITSGKTASVVQHGALDISTGTFSVNVAKKVGYMNTILSFTPSIAGSTTVKLSCTLVGLDTDTLTTAGQTALDVLLRSSSNGNVMMFKKQLTTTAQNQEIITFSQQAATKVLVSIVDGSSRSVVELLWNGTNLLEYGGMGESFGEFSASSTSLLFSPNRACTVYAAATIVPTQLSTVGPSLYNVTATSLANFVYKKNNFESAAADQTLVDLGVTRSAKLFVLITNTSTSTRECVELLVTTNVDFTEAYLSEYGLGVSIGSFGAAVVGTSLRVLFSPKVVSSKAEIVFTIIETPLSLSSSSAAIPSGVAPQISYTEYKDLVASTTHYMDVTLPNGVTYISDGLILSMDSPSLSSSVDRTQYKVVLADPNLGDMSAYQSGLVGCELETRLCFVDQETGQPYLATEDSFIVYKGMVDGVSYEIDTKELGEVRVTITGSSPIANLDQKRSIYLSRDSIRKRNSADSCCDQIYQGSGALVLKWGRR